MQIQAVLLLCASFGLAFRIPEGTPDGFYRTYVNETGHEIHEAVTEDMLERPTAKQLAEFKASYGTLVTKRQTTYDTWCGCGIELDHGNCDAAVADLKAQTGSGVLIQPYLSYYSIRGNVAAFGCNKEDWQTILSPDVITDLAAEITTRCGWYIAGTATWYREGAVVEPPLTGYLVWTPGTDICYSPDSSPASSC